MRIKIPIFMLVLLILSACNNQAEENYQQLLTSFERNDSSLNKSVEETTKNIEEDSNTDNARHDIKYKMSPQMKNNNRTNNSKKKTIKKKTKNIKKYNNRDKALHEINDKLIPQIEDFQQTVKNYQLEDDEQIKVQNSMLSYLEETKKLLKMYS